MRKAVGIELLGFDVRKTARGHRSSQAMRSWPRLRASSGARGPPRTSLRRNAFRTSLLRHFS